MFILASSVCKSLQCLISALTQGGKGGHLFRLTCSVLLGGGRNPANKYHRCVWRVLAVYGPHWVCPGHGSMCFPGVLTLLRLQVALWGCCPKRALCFMHFLGLSCSGSRSRVLHKGTDSVGPEVCTLPRSEQLRHPGVWRAGSLRLIASPVPAAQFSGCITGAPSQRDVDRPESQEVLVSNEAGLQFGR